MKRSPITVANEVVSIIAVCQLAGVELPDDVGTRSRKVHCPFEQAYHSDGGADPAMRVYPDSNSAYCFSCATYYTPVSLAAQAMDIDRHTAAVRLLDRVGYRPLDLVTAFAQHRDYTPALDKALLADALKTFCRRIDPGWSTRQFDMTIAAALTKCLAVLDLVNTPEDANLWLTRCKSAMQVTLHTPSTSEKENSDLW